MNQDFLIALIAAGGVAVGAVIALLGSWISGRFQLKATREDRQAAIEAEKQRWIESQQAEHEAWIRGEKLRIYTGLLTGFERILESTSVVNANREKNLEGTDRDRMWDYFTDLGRTMSELLLLAPNMRGSAWKAYQQCLPLLQFVDQHPGPLTEAVARKFEEALKRYSQSKAEFLMEAQKDIKIKVAAQSRS